MTPKIEKFLATVQPATPCLVVDVDAVVENYRRISSQLPLAAIYYAVKANPAQPILRRLVDEGSHFDAASFNEVEQCLSVGAEPEKISYGNTVKKQEDIAAAYARGVRTYAFDSAAELEKLAANAPGSRVYCRILTTGDGADWPLSRKFGCELDMARDLMLRAGRIGLDPYGISFHVGSQQTDPNQWDIAIGRAAMVFSDLRESGVDLRMINLGGGFPARYRDEVPDFADYADTISQSMTKHFGNDLPRMIVEPGRAIVAEAGVLEAKVVLISQKSYDTSRRWVYLDIGKFGGLAETMDEAIRYQITTPHDGGEEGAVVVAGPTCDGVDILYEKSGYSLPLDLAIGDRVQIHATGAYTQTYSAVGFNGFPPLAAHFL